MTIFIKIENILNHTPLINVSDDKPEIEPLTPTHFLFSGQVNDYPCNFAELINVTPTRESLIKESYIKHIY